MAYLHLFGVPTRICRHDQFALVVAAITVYPNQGYIRAIIGAPLDGVEEEDMFSRPLAADERFRGGSVHLSRIAGKAVAALRGAVLVENISTGETCVAVPSESGTIWFGKVEDF